MFKTKLTIIFITFLFSLGFVSCAQAATQIYRSVGPSAADALDAGTGDSNELTISGSVATFTVDVPDNIGVGDAIQYDSDGNDSIDAIMFVSGRTDSTHYTVKTVAGAAPGDMAVADTNWSIFRSYTSLSKAESGDENDSIDDAVETFETWADGKNITTSDEQWNITCYAGQGAAADTTAVTINGWTTDSDNFIKIYTPYTLDEVGESQRHNGTYDTTKYRIEGSDSDLIQIQEEYVRVDGLQFSISESSSNNAHCLSIVYITSPNHLYISNCIAKAVSVTGSGRAVGFWICDTDAVVELYNNIAYGFTGSSGQTAAYESYNATTVDFYNCTAYGNRTGFLWNSGTVTCTNCISGNNNYDFYGTMTVDHSASDDGNGTNPQTLDSSNDYENEFVDAANGDFHLVSDSVCIDNGTSDPGSGLYSDDIDLQPRSGSWDIGADEYGAKNVYYSVGQNATDHKTGSPTVTISGGTATFSTAQTATNMGVGDRITYDGFRKVYISGKTSTSVWTVVTEKGLVPPDITSATVNSIAHEYTSLSAAIAGALDSNHLNTADLVTGNYVLNFPCYYDTGADTTVTTIDGYTTGADNYIKVYAPDNTSTEVNQSQRHEGKAKDSGGNYTGFAVYKPNANGGVIRAYDDYTVIDGLIVEGQGTNDQAIFVRYSSNVEIKNCILKKTGGTQPSAAALYIYTGPTYVSNTLIYDSYYGLTAYAYTNVWAYNLTIIDSVQDGIDADPWTGYEQHFKNILAYSSGASDFDITNTKGGTITVEYSASSDASADDLGGAGNRINQTFTFVDEANNDFHLSPADSGAKDYGADLSGDANYPFTDDIDGQTRDLPGNGWDIGADEAATKIFRSVGPSKTTAVDDDNSQTETLTISGSTAVFNTAGVADNVGVGDVIIYDDDADNDLDASDSIVFIHARTNSQSFTVKDADGSAPSMTTTANDKWAVYRAYTSLSNAELGTKNTSIPISFTGGDRDLVANNEQWNIACYANGTTADTTKVPVDGWTTGVNNHLKIYTPVSANEVGASQRHNGVWDDGKYNLISSAAGTLTIQDEYVHIDGLQLKSTYNGAVGSYSSIKCSFSQAHYCRISNSIIDVAYGSTVTTAMGIWVYDATKVYVRNNIIYFTGSATGNIGLYIRGTTAYVYNNTVSGFINNYRSLYSAVVIAKNNIAQNSGTYGYFTEFGGSFDASSTNNISDKADAPGSNPINSVTVSFADSAAYDFHLALSDSTAKNAGTNLSADAGLAFSDDIDGDGRGLYWSVGADEPYGVTVQTSHSVDSNIDLDSGLVLYQSFDGADMDWSQSSAEARDKSGNNNHGNVTNFGPEGAVAGKKGQALSFDGVDDYVDKLNPSFSSDTEGTVSLWIKKTLNGRDEVFFYIGDSGTNFNVFQLYYDVGTNDYTILNKDTVDNYRATYDQADSTGVWQHVVFTVNSSGNKFFLDSQEVILSYSSGNSSNTEWLDDIANIDKIRIGDNHLSTATRYFDGLIDEVRIYNRALSEPEITALYRQGEQKIGASQAGKINNGLVGHWTFDGGDTNWTSATAGTTADRSGQGNTGTMTNMSRSSSPVIGKLGQALEFDGTDDRVNITDITIGINKTLSFWAKWNDTPNDFVLGGIGGGQYPIYITGTVVYSNAKGPVSHNGITTGVWTHFVLSIDGASLGTFYQDGVSLGSVASAGGNRIMGVIGGGNDGTYSVNGLIDDVRVYNRALSPDEIEDLYNLGKATIKN